MIRVEITIKDRYGCANPQDLERKVKREILSSVANILEENLAEPSRIQFLAPPMSKKKPKA